MNFILTLSWQRWVNNFIAFLLENNITNFVYKLMKKTHNFSDSLFLNKMKTYLI